MPEREHTLDHGRRERVGLDEAVFCAGKSPEQIAAIVEEVAGRGGSLLLTHLDEARFEALPAGIRGGLDYDRVSATGIHGPVPAPAGAPRSAVITAGTSDVPVAREAVRTLAYHGEPCIEVHDVGVAGLWRLLDRVEEIRDLATLIVVAGMDAALPSVVGGLVPGVVIAVPTATGYGVAAGGRTALDAALASCAPGLTVVNIGNGYGAACAALRVLKACGR